MQLTFQVVLSTDGRASFATFIYPNISNIRQSSGRQVVGFNAGDRNRLSNIAVNSLETVNLFRIDGTRHLQLATVGQVYCEIQVYKKDINFLQPDLSCTHCNYVICSS